MDLLSIFTDGIISDTIVIIPSSPLEPQSFLVKPLELPLPKPMTESLGVFQSDVIIRSALVAAIADIRSKPWLLDYVFASLPKDELTMGAYGEQEVDQAKKWFLKTDIPVVMAQRMDDVTLPCISISLGDSSESEKTLGDLHFNVREAADSEWLTIVELTPLNYNVITGVLGFKEGSMSEVPAFEGMFLMDAQGKSHIILDSDDSTISITPNEMADFSKCSLKGAPPSIMARLESRMFRETYHVGVHAQSEPVHLTYLHSIVVFCLLRYSQSLLEARGFERSSFNSSDFTKNEAFEQDNVYSRFVTLTGYVRHTWPKDIEERVQGIEVGFQIDGVDTAIGSIPLEDATWGGEEDDILGLDLEDEDLDDDSNE